jgi:DNA-directed RNA polymerase specialized sigma24 family protein
MGKEMFRANVTNYQVHGFDDVVIFVHDVDRCLAKLGTEHYELIERLTLQEYTQEETADLLGIPVRTLLRRYADALDELTRILLDRKLLEPQTACQEAESWR